MPLSLKILVVICASAFFLTFLLLAKRGSVKPFYFSNAATLNINKEISSHNAE